jgi:hypothetical protein
MLRALACLALIACGGKDPAPSAPSSASTTSAPEPNAPAESTEPLPPVTKVGDRCRLSKDCNPLGPHHKCMRSATGSHCYESPMKVCDAPDCSCFNNDPCAANELGTCAGYDKGVVICSK